MRNKDICKIPKEKDKKTKQGKQSLVFTTEDGDIIKSIFYKKDYEKEWLEKLKKRARGRIKYCFNLPIVQKRCREYNYYLFEKLDGDLDVLLKKVSKKVRKNLLLQCLVVIYTLNIKWGINHNDLFNEKGIKNVMYVKISEPFYLGYGVEAEKYIVKFIDFGQAGEGIPGFKNIKFKIDDIDSEPLIFIDFFFKTIFGTDVDLRNELVNIYTSDIDLIDYVKNNFNKLYHISEVT